MRYKLSLRTQAEQDIQSAFEWYYAKSPRAAQKLIVQLEDTFKLLSKNPLSFPIRYKNTRFVELKNFPIGVHYIVQSETKTVVVLAVLSSLQDPKKWDLRNDL